MSQRNETAARNLDHVERAMPKQGRIFKRALKAVSASAFAASLLFLMPACAQGSQSTSAVTSETVSASSSAGIDIAGMDFDYTDRDKDASYDESEAVKINLAGTSATVDGEGASVDGSTVTITAPGTYLVSGELTDGQLVVDMEGDDDKAQVVLAGATIHNETGPAINITSADKVFLTLADGTENALTDGAEYDLEEGEDEPYATLFSKDDLTINGTGTLKVTSSYRHAICSKDDLVITGGTFEITSAEDGLRGRDCVKIADGTFTIDAVGDGIKSNNDEDPVRGFISLDGGTFDIKAGDDGVQSATYFRVTGGTVNINSDDDAFNSDIQGNVSGGSITINAADDAIHAETQLDIDGGTIDVQSCEEGFEAEKIYINAGDSSIKSNDDGVNASLADTGTSTAEASFEGQMPQGGFTQDESQRTQAQILEDQGDVVTVARGDRGAFGGDNADSDTNRPTPPSGAPNDGGIMGNPGMGTGTASTACLLEINGGTLIVDAGGDGLDSNGSIVINGGEVYVSGATSSANSGLDYEYEATINGGTVVIVGAMGMAETFTGGEQPFLFTQVSGSAGGELTIASSNGTTLASWAPPKGYQCVVASVEGMEEGQSYTVSVGGSSVEATASTTPTSTGNMMRGPMGNQG